MKIGYPPPLDHPTKVKSNMKKKMKAYRLKLMPLIAYWLKPVGYGLADILSFQVVAKAFG